jgi:gamma-glutamylcyclotransferase (GGCT)/AIG2-like uncharacterized protein YtfP
MPVAEKAAATVVCGWSPATGRAVACILANHADSPIPVMTHSGRAGLVSLFVNGTLMRGEPLHGNLAGATFIGPAQTASRYRLLSVRDIHPAMILAGPSQGVAVSGELYDLDLGPLQHVLEEEPPGLGLGVVELQAGNLSLGIVWTAAQLPDHAEDISAFGGWREYRASQGSPRTPHSDP